MFVFTLERRNEKNIEHDELHEFMFDGFLPKWNYVAIPSAEIGNPVVI